MDMDMTDVFSLEKAYTTQAPAADVLSDEVLVDIPIEEPSGSGMEETPVIAGLEASAPRSEMASDEPQQRVQDSRNSSTDSVPNDVAYSLVNVGSDVDHDASTAAAELRSSAVISDYCSAMEVASSLFPLDDEALAALHRQHYDAAYEKLLLTATVGASPSKSAADRVRTAEARTALLEAKKRFSDDNEQKGINKYIVLLSGDDKSAALHPDKIVDVALASSSSCHRRWTAAALSALIERFKFNSLGAETNKAIADITAAKIELENTLTGQIRANRLLGSRVEELEKENSDLHRILDDNTNKALDSWSTGQIRIAKLEEELNAVKEEKQVKEKELASAWAQLREAEIKVTKLKAGVEKILDDEEEDLSLKPEEMGFLGAAFACLPWDSGAKKK